VTRPFGGHRFLFVPVESGEGSSVEQLGLRLMRVHLEGLVVYFLNGSYKLALLHNFKIIISCDVSHFCSVAHVEVSSLCFPFLEASIEHLNIFTSKKLGIVNGPAA